MFSRIWMLIFAALLAAIIGLIGLVAGFVLLVQIASFLFVAALILGLVVIIRERFRERP